MTTIFLVEDEAYALKVLHQKILDLNENYEIVGTADNGLSALEQLPDASPDIVITDIHMPDMDGLTLIEKLKEAGCSALPVIISGYQEFDYAKQAVRLGVADYLLKPVNPEELKSCLASCKKRVKKQRKNIISFFIGDDSLSFEAAKGQDTFFVIYIIIANPLSTVENMIHPNVRYIPNNEMERLFPKRHSKQFIHCFDGFFSNEKVMLLNYSDIEAQILEASLQQLAENLRELSHQYITIFHTVTKKQALAVSVRHCYNGAIANMVFGHTGVYSSLPQGNISGENINSIADLYALLLQQKQPDLLRSNIRRLFLSWSEKQRLYVDEKNDLVFLLNSLKQKFLLKKEFDFNSHYFLENIISFSSNHAEFADNFCQLLIQMFMVSEPEVKTGEDLVETILAYFKNNLSSNVTLQTLEEEMGLSKVYLCRIFKKYNGITPIESFTRLKIEKAKELIIQFPDLSLRKISESLGFNDVYYFSKVLKKITGIAPSEMRSVRCKEHSMAGSTDSSCKAGL